MEQNSIEQNVVARFFLGFGVIMTMAFVGERLALGLLAYGVPYGEWIGVGVGAVAVFAAFAVVYARFTTTDGYQP